MTQWETRTTKSLVTDKNWSLQDDADKWGKQGWKIVSVLIQGSGAQAAIYVVYQRPVQPAAPKAPSIEV